MSDAEATKAAMTALELAKRGDFAGVLAMFAPAPQRRLTAEAIDAAWQTHVARHGAVWSMERSGIHSDSGMTQVSVVLRTPSTALEAVVSVDGRGRLLNLQVTPLAVPWQHPDYANPASFDEVDVALGDRPLVVGGTLITGGRGHYAGMLGGVLLLTALLTLLAGTTLPHAVRDIIFGLVVLGAVLALRERSA